MRTPPQRRFVVTDASGSSLGLLGSMRMRSLKIGDFRISFLTYPKNFSKCSCTSDKKEEYPVRFFSRWIPQIDESDVRDLYTCAADQQRWEQVLDRPTSCGWFRLGFRSLGWPRPLDESVRRAAHELDSCRSEKAGRAAVLFCADQTWQPDNRIVRHKGLWGRVASSDELSDVPEVYESYTESTRGLRYYSALHLNHVQLPAASAFARQHRSSFVLLVRRPRDLLRSAEAAEVYRAAFGGSGREPDKGRFLPDWAGVVNWAVANDAVVVRSFGHSDDVAAGLDILAATDTLFEEISGCV